ncbi:MAG: hypothetical protein JWM21_2214 [Acidobacteria bacterium]|nr:hypothetical protein [Acidobacteriota bacterium]
MEKRTTRIARSWGATIGYLIGAIVAFGVAILLFMTIVEGAISFGFALIPAILALILLFMSFGGAGATTCPGCDAQLGGLSTKSNDGVLCAGCHRYSEGKDGLLWQTDENRIADDPVFTSPLPAQFTFPQGCCVCGQPEVRREKITLRMQNASSVVTVAAVGVTTSTTVSVEVPHCAEHKEGARLSGTPQSTHIRFRSYPYLRAFCQVNGTTPG